MMDFIWFNTDFTDVGHSSKSQPSLIQDVDSTLRLIASWKYIITTDLSLEFQPNPLMEGLYEILRCGNPS